MGYLERGQVLSSAAGKRDFNQWGRAIHGHDRDAQVYGNIHAEQVVEH